MADQFFCRACRAVLFATGDIQPHAVGSGYDPTRRSSSDQCTSIFLSEPQPWMDTADVDGKVLCPKCKVRVGAFSWSGSQCSCGTWVTPAIQMSCGKVEQRHLFILPQNADLATPTT
eukprot:gnl/Hemi2/3108_TR1100_c0_g1_i1.p1 gnl/Hemi2/3108_TR1100_c0_g1~~gnl/Hemi2/3108_TR1100_c0_g1_i1.p1  ORF type:complete len:127 (-),score=21.78 gnl/Hemi2/3108_TR1100_c0_g1_i1:215-565(-)